MLSGTDRGGIRDSLKEWSKRVNIPDSVLNDFIEIALSKANRSLRIPPLETFSVETISPTGYIAIPSNFIEAKELKILINNRTVILERKSIHEVDSVANVSGWDPHPTYFGRFGNFLRISPWSGDGTETLTMYYYNVIPAMTSDTDTNWFTDFAPECLLYGALTELSAYTRDSEGVSMWGAKFNESITTIQAVEDRAEWEGSTVAVTLAGSTRLGN
jgi:hypothetical protein